MKMFLVVAGGLLLSAAVLTAAEAIKSGLQAGEGVPAFQVLDVTGPNKGKQLCYV